MATESDLLLLDQRWEAIRTEIDRWRRLMRDRYADDRTQEWWCQQVHLARAQERQRVIAYLERRGFKSVGAEIAAGHHEEEP
jgi:hypothetical protein